MADSVPSDMGSSAQDINNGLPRCNAALLSLAEKAIALYYAVRDRIRYDPYDLRYSRPAMQARAILAKQSGYCVAKAVLLRAVGRHRAFPAASVSPMSPTTCRPPGCG